MAESKETAKSGSQWFSVALWMALSIAMIVIGSIHIDDCPVEPKIPIYLIVAGVVYVVGFTIIPLKKVTEASVYTTEGILALFSFCWFITGSVWVFRIYQDNPRGCNDTVYNFAFGILIFEYIFLAISAASICLCTCCFGILRSASNSETTNQPPEGVQKITV
ncbi:transmembrane protein 272-like [Discoglossus pictus]